MKYDLSVFQEPRGVMRIFQFVSILKCHALTKLFCLIERQTLKIPWSNIQIIMIFKSHLINSQRVAIDIR